MFPDDNSGHSFFDFPLTASDLTGPLSEADRLRLDALKKHIHFNAGCEIFKVGEAPESVYFLRNGRVSLIHKDREPDVFSTRPPHSEKIFGVIETLSDCPFDATMVSATDCEVDVVPRQMFLSVLVERPRLCFQLARIVSSRYRHTLRLIGAR